MKTEEEIEELRKEMETRRDENAEFRKSQFRRKLEHEKMHEKIIKREMQDYLNWFLGNTVDKGFRASDDYLTGKGKKEIRRQFLEEVR